MIFVHIEQFQFITIQSATLGYSSPLFFHSSQVKN